MGKSAAVPPSAIERLDAWRVRVRRYRPDMLTEGRIYASRDLFRPIERDETLLQVANVATLPGTVGPSMAMPDAHQGYGFPIGGVLATDAEGEGVVSPGGVGFDINCGVRLLTCPVPARDVREKVDALLAAMARTIPLGFDTSRDLKVAGREMDALLRDGAAWAVSRGLGEPRDLERLEDGGRMPGADPDQVSELARERGANQVGTLGSGNHFLEIQEVDQVWEEEAARAMGLRKGTVAVLLHTGSRGLGHQVCTDHLAALQREASKARLDLPDRQLAWAPIASATGQRYLGAMAAAANFAWANRQVLTHRVRACFAEVMGPGVPLDLVWDVSHNMARLERHQVDGRPRTLCVHRKGATRAFPAGHPSLPRDLSSTGQPVLIPGSMGTCSYVLVGTPQAMEETWGSVCHGAGRSLSRTGVRKTVQVEDVLRDLEARDIRVHAASRKGLVEECPEAYKDVSMVVDTVVGAGLAREVARLAPMGVIKG